MDDGDLCLIRGGNAAAPLKRANGLKVCREDISSAAATLRLR